MDNDHGEAPGYGWESSACLMCHLYGRDWAAEGRLFGGAWVRDTRKGIIGKKPPRTLGRGPAAGSVWFTC